jgi:hypothetical protein
MAQVVVNNKFAGIMVTIMLFILNATLVILGLDHDLYLFGGSSIGTYSDMNGFGHFMKPYLIIKIYWFSFGILLLIIVSAISVRGTETNLIKRLKVSKYRISKSIIKLGLITFASFIILCSYIFYNTNILNKYWTNSEKTAFKVDYEKTLKITSKKHDLTGIKVFDKLEEFIPNLGLVQMFDQETKQVQLIDTSSKFVRDSYKKESSLKFKTFNDLFTTNGAGTILCRTDESYIKKLLNYFKNRG